MATESLIKSILNVRCREGATVAEIQDDYAAIVGKSLPDAFNCLKIIDGVYCEKDPTGVARWYVKSEKLQHITKLILDQKPTQVKPCRQTEMNQSTDGNDCFFKDNNSYKNKRQYKYRPYYVEKDNNNNTFNGHQYETISTTPILPRPFLHAQVCGDDVFRELFTRDSIRMFNQRNGIQQNELCISGLSIQAAAKIIEYTFHFKSSKLVINVGSVDIVHGKDLKEMCFDFDQLIRACEMRGLDPIISTLAPLVNISHSKESHDKLHDKLHAFNEFLRDKYFCIYPIIDIWREIVKPSTKTDISCYKTELNIVNGNYHVMWNRRGRILIYDYIERYLSQFLNIGTTERVQFGA